MQPYPGSDFPSPSSGIIPASPVAGTGHFPTPLVMTTDPRSAANMMAAPEANRDALVFLLYRMINIVDGSPAGGYQYTSTIDIKNEWLFRGLVNILAGMNIAADSDVVAGATLYIGSASGLPGVGNVGHLRVQSGSDARFDDGSIVYIGSNTSPGASVLVGAYSSITWQGTTAHPARAQFTTDGAQIVLSGGAGFTSDSSSPVSIAKCTNLQRTGPEIPTTPAAVTFLRPDVSAPTSGTILNCTTADTFKIGVLPADVDVVLGAPGSTPFEVSFYSEDMGSQGHNFSLYTPVSAGVSQYVILFDNLSGGPGFVRLRWTGTKWMCVALRGNVDIVTSGGYSDWIPL